MFKLNLVSYLFQILIDLNQYENNFCNIKIKLTKNTRQDLFPIFKLKKIIKTMSRFLYIILLS